MAINFAAVSETENSKEQPATRKWNISLGAGKVKSDDRMFFTEQLALLLETGANLHAALETVAGQTQNPAMQSVVRRMAQDISEGKSFGYALAQHASVFSTTYVSLITASEQGGFMYEVLQQLLEMEHKREELKATLFSAAAYPLFLITFSFAVVIFVLVVVFPKFGKMFNAIYDQLPATTRVLMSVSDVLRSHWIYILLGVAALALGVRHWLASDQGTLAVDKMKLRMPVLSGVFVQIYLVQMLRVLALSLGNGVSVMESLDACRDVVKNSLFRKLIRDVEQRVQDGGGVAAGFASAEFIPPLAAHMITTGEQSGKLAKVMNRIADYYETQLTKKLDALAKLAEPVMLLVMGVVVGVLVSSLILPIFKLSRAVS